MMRVCSLLIVSIVPLLAACGGGDDGGSTPLPDATPPPPDATPLPDGTLPPTVTIVPCPGASGIALNVTVKEPRPYTYAFAPPPEQGVKPTIKAGDVVRFDMQRNHSAVSGAIASGADGEFAAPFNAVTCLRFASAGDFSFYCNVHVTDQQHEASLVVTPN